MASYRGYDYDEFVKYGELRKTRRAPTDQEAASIVELEAKMMVLQEQMEALAEADTEEGDEDREYERLESESEGLQAQFKALENTLNVWPADLMAQAGCVVFVGNDGAVALKCGLVRPEDRSDMAQAARLAGEGGGDESLVSLPSPKTRPVHSEKLMRRLTAHRVVAVQAELIDRLDVALAALAAQLAQKMFRDNDRRYYRLEPFFAITATDSEFELRSAADDLESCAAWAKVQAERAAWAKRLPTDLDAIFPWLLAQDQATVLQLLTFVVAVTTVGIRGTEPEWQSNDALAQAVGLDMSKWWTATGPSYFNHVSKGRILEVVTEAVDANAASPLATLKKDAAVMGPSRPWRARAGCLPYCGSGYLRKSTRLEMPTSHLWRMAKSMWNRMVQRSKRRSPPWPGNRKSAVSNLAAGCTGGLTRGACQSMSFELWQRRFQFMLRRWSEHVIREDRSQYIGEVSESSEEMTRCAALSQFGVGQDEIDAGEASPRRAAWRFTPMTTSRCRRQHRGMTSIASMHYKCKISA